MNILNNKHKTKNNLHKKIITALAIITTLFLIAGCTGNATLSAQPVDAGQESDTPIEPEKVFAPNFATTTTAGEEISLESFKGKPSIVYFMASWCSKCAKNWEALNEVYPNYKDDVNFVAISIDPTDSKEILQGLGNTKNFVFETVPGNPELALEFGVTAQTAKFAIGADGEILKRHDGVLTSEEWDEWFSELVQ